MPSRALRNWQTRSRKVLDEVEAAQLQAYLPPQLTENDVRAMVREAVAGGAKDLGTVMKALTPKTKGKFDSRELNRIVREEIGG